MAASIRGLRASIRPSRGGVGSDGAHACTILSVVEPFFGLVLPTGVGTKMRHGKILLRGLG